MDYVYFFEGSFSGAQIEPAVVMQHVLLAHLLEGKKDPDDEKVREELIRKPATRDQVITDLRLICQKKKIRIFFMPSKPSLQFVIHNAEAEEDALLYLKHEGAFIFCDKGSDAMNFWQEIQKLHNIGPQLPQAVFFGSAGFDVKAGSFY